MADVSSPQFWIETIEGLRQEVDNYDIVKLQGKDTIVYTIGPEGVPVSPRSRDATPVRRDTESFQELLALLYWSSNIKVRAQAACILGDLGMSGDDLGLIIFTLLMHDLEGEMFPAIAGLRTARAREIIRIYPEKSLIWLLSHDAGYYGTALIAEALAFVSEKTQEAVSPLFEILGLGNKVTQDALVWASYAAAAYWEAGKSVRSLLPKIRNALQSQDSRRRNASIIALWTMGDAPPKVQGHDLVQAVFQAQSDGVPLNSLPGVGR